MQVPWIEKILTAIKPHEYDDLVDNAGESVNLNNMPNFNQAEVNVAIMEHQVPSTEIQKCGEYCLAESVTAEGK